MKTQHFHKFYVLVDEEKNKSEPIYVTDGCGKENMLFTNLGLLQKKINKTKFAFRNIYLQ